MNLEILTPSTPQEIGPYSVDLSIRLLTLESAISAAGKGTGGPLFSFLWKQHFFI